MRSAAYASFPMGLLVPFQLRNNFQWRGRRQDDPSLNRPPKTNSENRIRASNLILDLPVKPFFKERLTDCVPTLAATELLIVELPPSDLGRTEVSAALPGDLERRLVFRLLNYWKLLRDERDFPSFSDVNPLEIPEIWKHCLVLEVLDGSDDPIFRAIGDGLKNHADSGLVGLRVSAIGQNTLLSSALSYTDAVFEKRAPVCRGGNFENTTLLYRSIILPMSDDGETISGLLAAFNHWA